MADVAMLGMLLLFGVGVPLGVACYVLVSETVGRGRHG